MTPNAHRFFITILFASVSCSALSQQPSRQALECEGQQVTETTSNGKTETERKTGTTTMSIDFESKRVYDSVGFGIAATITNDLIRYGGYQEQELGTGATKTKLKITISGTLNRISGALSEQRTVQAMNPAFESITIVKSQAECSPQARRF